MTPWNCGTALSKQAFAQLRRRAIFDFGKWHGKISSFPLIMRAESWREVQRLAQAMACELSEAESLLIARTDLHDQLGLPRNLRPVLSELPHTKGTPCGARLLRFDFHWTKQGWQISEANTDVASGFIESSSLTQLMQAHFPGCRTCGDPAGVLASRIVESIGPAGRVGLMYLSVYSEDRQVVLYLARRFSEAGLTPQLFSPWQLNWTDRRAAIETEWYQGELDFLYRFLPAEWIAQMPPASGWMHAAHSGATPTCNTLSSVLVQSKRFPLVWEQLGLPLTVLRSLLPETVAPQDIEWRDHDDWIVKPALGHEGIRIGMPGVTTAAEWEEIDEGLKIDPDQWVVQRRFETLPISTLSGPLYPSLGVYVIDGEVAGAYGRLSRSPLINDEAADIVILIGPD